MNYLNKDQLVSTCKRLEYLVDANQLQEEIENIPLDLWGEIRADVHQDVDAVFVKGYPPKQRKPDDIRPILNELPYLRSIIYDLLPGSPAKCVIAKLKPGGYVRMHRDGYVEDVKSSDLYFYNYFYSTVRIHIPVITNNEVLFFCNGKFFQMAPGEVWAVNNTSDHAAINNSELTERIHIIFDLAPTKELVNLINDTEEANGEFDKTLVSRLMKDSNSPIVSPYAAGKAAPLT